MGSAAVLAAALTTGGAKARSLWVGGLDVLREPGAAGGTAYGALTDTIEVRNAGPGGVSSLSVEVDDPTSELGFEDGAHVLYYDHTEGWPLFVGVLDHYAAIPDFGGQARRWTLEATGLEAVLDWRLIASDVTIAAGTQAEDAIQLLAGIAMGVGVPIRAFQKTGEGSTIANPIDDVLGTMEVAATIPAGTSLREAIRIVLAAVPTNPGEPDYGQTVFTVDEFAGLRVGDLMGGIWAPFALDDSAIGTLKMSALTYEIDATGPRQVLVRGSGVGASVTDGTGKPGAVADISDNTLTTVEACRSAGAAYLADVGRRLRGSFVLEDVTFADLSTPGVQRVTAMSELQLTISAVGISGEIFEILGITKTFAGGALETWSIEFGGMAPSLTSAIRRLTRGTRS